MDVNGKVAVVTGGASGIGYATAEALLGAGARVVLGDIEAPALKEATATLAAKGEVHGVVCDVARLEDVERLRDEALSQFGAVHVLFNNAGVGGGTLLGSPIELWRWVSSVNIDGVVHGLHVFLPGLLEQDEGHVVNTASLAGLGGVPFMGPYCATKFAVVGLSESLYQELLLRQSKVGVSVLCPGFVRTRIAESSRNLPPALRDREATEESAAAEKFAADAVAAGIDPSIVAGEVLGAIQDSRFWILPHRHVAVRTTEQRLEWIQGGPPPTYDLERATRGG